MCCSLVIFFNSDKLVKQYGDLDGELHVVDLNRESTNGADTFLGIDLAGNRSLETMSVFVARILPNGLVSRDGRIHVGDELLEVGYCHRSVCLSFCSRFELIVAIGCEIRTFKRTTDRKPLASFRNPS